MGKVGTTRAEATAANKKGVVTTNGENETTSLKTVEFGVFGYLTTGAFGTESTWDPTTPVQTNMAPNFMYNQELVWNAAGFWGYTPVKYWPNGNDVANGGANPSNTATQDNTNPKYLSFFAYAPFTSIPASPTDYNGATDGNAPDGNTASTPINAWYTRDKNESDGIVAMSKNNETADMWVKYKMSTGNSKNAVDLLWAVRGQHSYSQTDNATNNETNLGSVYNVNLTKQTVDEKVKFLFKHALAKVGGAVKDDNTSAGTTPKQSGIKVVLDVDANSGNALTGSGYQNQYQGSSFNNTSTLVTINDIKIRDKYTYTVTEDGPSGSIADENSDLASEGWFDIMNGKWDKVAITGVGTPYIQEINTAGTGITPYVDLAYELNPAIKEIGIGSGKKELNGSDANQWSTSNPTGVTTTPQSVYSNVNAPGLVLIPGTGTGVNNTLYITVDYFVRTADKNLATGYTEVRQVITNKVELGTSLDPNKYYTLIIHLGLTSVKFEAVVADWTHDDGTTYDENGDPIAPGSPVENGTSIWLPSNVVNYTTTTTVLSGTHQTVNVAANQTSYNITLNKLTENNTISVATSGTGITSATATPTTVPASGTITVAVVLPDNSSASTPTNGLVTITEEDGSSNVISTTTVQIIHAQGTWPNP